MRWLIYLAIVFPLCWFFGAVLLAERVLDFRDISHYYRPLWQWTSEEWLAGRVPLWCDRDGLGIPTHADPTASIFYPGQIVFLLPLSFTTRLNAYVVLHVLLAAVLCYRTARGFDASRPGAALAALGYAFGGYVLFQYCNPIYLVGAAWLPLAVLAIERTGTTPSWRWAAVLAVSTALIVLGGDLQLAYHVGVISALYVWLARRSSPLRTTSSRLVAGLLVAGLLAAIQLIPSAEWSRHSQRAQGEDPRSVWELGREGSLVRGVLAAPEAHTHHERIYDFSSGPWRWLELVWPNVGGRLFPQHHRWMTAIPAEGRVWTPSLYVGLVPLIGALAAFSLRRTADVRIRWLSWMTLLGLVGSLGIYGLGWLYHEVTAAVLGADPNQPPVFGAVGGLYWLMVVALPGYVQFRYPAKLMVLASLGVCLLAARGWDQIVASPPQRGLKRGLLLIVATSLAIAACAPLLRLVLHGLPAEYPFGPLVVDGVVFDVLWSGVQTAMIAGLLLLLVLRYRERRWMPLLTVAVTAIDLCVAHGWMISSSHDAESFALPQESLRLYRAPLRGAHFDAALPPTDNRLAELRRWEQATLAEKMGLSTRANVANMSTALEPSDLAALWREIDRDEPNPAALALLGVDGILYPSHDLIAPQTTRLTPLPFPVSAAYLLRDDPGDDLSLANVTFVDVERVSPTRVEINTSSDAPRWLVLADYHARGWRCEIIDEATGLRRAVPIERVHRVLRGVSLPAGRQRVVFRYRPLSLYLAASISGAAWCAIAVYTAVEVGQRRRR